MQLENNDSVLDAAFGFARDSTLSNDSEAASNCNPQNAQPTACTPEKQAPSIASLVEYGCGPNCLFGDGASVAETGSMCDDYAACACPTVVQDEERVSNDTSEAAPKLVKGDWNAYGEFIPAPQDSFETPMKTSGVPFGYNGAEDLEGFVCTGCGVVTVIGFEGCFEFEGIRCQSCWRKATIARRGVGRDGCGSIGQKVLELLEFCARVEFGSGNRGGSEIVDSRVFEDLTGVFESQGNKDVEIVSPETLPESLGKKMGKKRAAEEDDAKRRRRNRSKRCKKRRIRRRE